MASQEFESRQYGSRVHAHKPLLYRLMRLYRSQAWGLYPPHAGTVVRPAKGEAESGSWCPGWSKATRHRGKRFGGMKKWLGEFGGRFKGGGGGVDLLGESEFLGLGIPGRSHVQAQGSVVLKRL